ncbi:flagellar hook protein FlgE [Paracoccus aerodenitrificans]|uniref:flagellar hook protein FlgE n=1 Tax=Paracoccus aerodenitrificans TaxID=3017781 RepID=UPI0022F0351B|nr:flagellar hook-basal body complex protein [Paracoccus aerodenitrificans]WBU63873.1 flagellar hook-basal body complex protein [Paracoccus aerodenitrificans]
MSISSSLNAGVAGLAANATRLASISDNISNSGTYGYKRVIADFEGMVINQARGAGVYSAGGVRASTARLIDQRGTLVPTSNPTDLAISGRGMLPVMPSVAIGSDFGDKPMMMTTTGSFRTDDEGVLRTESGLVLLGWPANADGKIPLMPRDTMGGLQPVIINANQTAGDPTTKMSLGINLPATGTEAGGSTDALTSKIEYFGNLGTSESMSVSFTPSTSHSTGMSNKWTMEIRDSATADDGATPADESIIATLTLIFSNDQTKGGTLAQVQDSGGAVHPAYNATNGTLALTVGKTATYPGDPMTITIGKLGDPNGLTQLGDDFAPTNISKDGSPVGNLTAVEVDEKGYIRATYDTGFIRTIYQIPLVDVPNPNGLISLNNQTYQVSTDSGSFFLWDAGDGPTGKVVGYAREGSTTDVAAELTDLIQTQRAYSSNAKVIQTVDEMLQETTNIKR